MKELNSLLALVAWNWRICLSLTKTNSPTVIHHKHPTQHDSPRTSPEPYILVSAKNSSYLPLHLPLQLFPQMIIGPPITIDNNTQIPKNVKVQP